MQSKAKTPKEYINELPEDRRAAIKAVRAVIKKNLPSGYKEMIQYGMITYVVPLTTYLKGYLDEKDVPLPYISLASQKNHMAVYLMNIYQVDKSENWFKSEYKKSGKKLDMGKSCVRFKKLDDLPLDVIGKAVALTPVKKFIENYEKGRGEKRN